MTFDYCRNTSRNRKFIIFQVSLKKIGGKKLHRKAKTA